ncbi:MAG: hypothetical protein OEY23_19870 [Acidimicrobiia bacterium]|nr:hypothetical protein [Acidimicrobiia bacterium]
MDRTFARRLWEATETVHAVAHHAPEVRDQVSAVGVPEAWMGRLACRLAPLGPIEAPVASALLVGYHPRAVGEVVPEVWYRLAPETALAAQLHGVDQALWRLVDTEVRSPEIAALAQLVRRAAESADCEGRPLAAAHQSLDWPTVAHLTLWHGCTVLREHRGGGHVAALVAEGVSGIHAHVLAVAAGLASPNVQRRERGYRSEEWRAAVLSAQERGWLSPTGGLTPVGRRIKARIENRTDDRSLQPYESLSTDETARLIGGLVEFAAKIVAAEGVVFPNAVGLPRPAGRPSDAERSQPGGSVHTVC